jgi:nucleoside triphosphatase
MPEQKFPEPTVGALIFDQKDRLFLMKSHKWHGKYVIPGGHIEVGETAEQALIREIKEETALRIYDIEFICYQNFIFDKAFFKKKHFLFLDFSCKTKTKKVILNSEGQDHVWVTIEETMKMPIDSYTRKTIDEYLRKKQSE